MTDHTDLLEQSFELNLNNYGPEDVERLNDWAINAYAALETLQAEVARLIRDRDSVWALKEHKEVLLSQMTSERDAALARLAEIEAQESVATVLLHEGEKIIDGTMAFMDTAWLGMPLFASAGASPVEPSQALSLDLLERLSKTLTRLGYATPEGGMEHFNADLTNQLYNLCRAVDSLFDREQPPAPSDTAREYMTGYSDGREWAGATSQAQPSQALELVNTQRVCFIRGWDARGMFSGPESSEERDMRMRELLDAYYPHAAINAKERAAPQPKETK